MAARNIEVVIKVRDNASRKLKDMENKVKRSGKAAKRASLDFKDFNRTLFATTAFVGTFIKTFSVLSNSLDMGAQLDRVDRQFERVLGPSSKMLTNIRSMTDATVDSVEAMRAGIALSNSGITSSSEDTARLIAMSAAVARRAGLDTTEGIKRVTQFAKSGSVASLEFLNLVRSTDPAFMAQIELMKQAGGALGGTLSTQQKVAIGMRALELAAKGQMKGHRDLQDVIKGVTDSYGIFRKVIGRFLGTALSPLLDKMTEFFYKMSTGLEDLRKSSKEFVFLAKATVVTTASVLGLAGALGTLRLATMALGSLGFGLPKLILLTATLGTAFLGITDQADSFIDKLRVFGGFIQGVYQLITGFDDETGISKIDSSLKKLLKENKIYEFAKIIARGGILVKRTFTDIVEVVTSVALKIDNIFGNTFRTVIDKISEFNKPWDLALLGAENKWKRIAGLITVIGGGFALKKLFGAALSRIPVIGRFFGGSSQGPKGTASDPIFTMPLTGGLGGVGKKIGKIAGLGTLGAFLKSKLGRVGVWLKSAMGIAVKSLRTGLTKLPGLLLRVLSRGITLLFTTVLGKLALAAGAGVLAGKGANYLADKYTTETNQYGQESNIFERGMAKLHTFLPKSMGGITDEDYKQMYDPSLPKVMGPGSPQDTKLGKSFLDSLDPTGLGAQSAMVNVPVPDNTVAYLDQIGAQMQSVDAAEAKRMQAATEQALASGQEGAGIITDEEMNSITNSFGKALDNSKVMNDIRDNTAAQADDTPTTRRPM
jgi:hypothetical protein